MNTNQKISVYIEIEQNSNIKYEFDKKQGKLIVDRILDEPYVYPYAYGYIPNTLADDNDELDILIISNKECKNDSYYDVYIIGCLIMEDEKGMDEKILCVFEEDYDKIYDIPQINDDIKIQIYSFFSNYKNKSEDRWSKVIGFVNKNEAIELYKKSLLE